MEIPLGLSFDDILLIPRKSSINSRFSGEIDLSTHLTPDLKLKFPIIAANMDSVCGPEMACKMNSLGGTGICHRFMSIGDHLSALSYLLQRESYPIIGCIGVGEEGKRRAEAILNSCGIILIDIAHGHSDAVADQVVWLKKQTTKPIIAGNVATADGARFLLSLGIQAIKVGVGNGSVCQTRAATGNGVPQATAIISVREEIDRQGLHTTLIADGGIRTSGDIVKSLALGANAVMIGNLVAGTTEAPGKVIIDRGIPKKRYRGMASSSAQEDWKGIATSIEGETTYVPYKGDVERIFNDLVAGILSGMSYQNARNINELKKMARFIRQTSAGRIESSAHGI